MSDIEDYPVHIERSVSWGQMDAFQHVNNVEYFRFFEDARIAYFEAMGIYDPTASEPFERVGPILAATSCQFKAPLTYPDDIVVGARTTDPGTDRFRLEYAISSETTGRIVATGDSEVVTYDYQKGHKVDVPDAWHKAIERLHSGD